MPRVCIDFNRKIDEMHPNNIAFKCIAPKSSHFLFGLCSIRKTFFWCLRCVYKRRTEKEKKSRSFSRYVKCTHARTYNLCESNYMYNKPTNILLLYHYHLMQRLVCTLFDLFVRNDVSLCLFLVNIHTDRYTGK